MKQKNALPPNFIHSLDSTHMMLTSLYCHHAGITFASVHDCFWTHANSVEVMNRICRQQFVALHSEPILEELSEYFAVIYSHGLSGDEKAFVNGVLQRKLEKGTFKLENVLYSTYFFS